MKSYKIIYLIGVLNISNLLFVMNNNNEILSKNDDKKLELPLKQDNEQTNISWVAKYFHDLKNESSSSDDESCDDKDLLEHELLLTGKKRQLFVVLFPGEKKYVISNKKTVIINEAGDVTREYNQEGFLEKVLLDYIPEKASSNSNSANK